MTEVISNLPEEWKAIDILVNNAGLAVGMDHIDAGNIDDWEQDDRHQYQGTSVCYKGSIATYGCKEQGTYFQYRINSREGKL